MKIQLSKVLDLFASNIVNPKRAKARRMINSNLGEYMDNKIIFDRSEMITLELAISLAIKQNELIKDIDEIVYISTKKKFEECQQKIWKVLY